MSDARQSRTTGAPRGPSSGPGAGGAGAAPGPPPHRYTAALAAEIEAHWQGRWEQEGAFRQPNPGEAGFDARRPKFYCLDMFPYPSGAGLHVGHPEGYTATDILCRYKRMQGFNVLHPMGWDAFGLPAEQYAIATGVHPSVTTRTAIDNFRRQLKRFGFSYDWSREFGTIDPEYYRWTQWIFLQIYNAWFDPREDRARPIAELIAELESGDLRVDPEGGLVHVGGTARTLEGLSGDPGVARQWHELSAREQREVIDDQRLAYVGEQVVNWCPKLGTALANEEVIDGRSERGGFPVLRKPLRQWLFRITAYAERLLAGLEHVDWPQSTRTQQAEWIGRSEGAEIDFEMVEPQADLPPFLRVFTTRPDTVFGATYMVVAPEHPVVDAALAEPRPGTPVDELRAYADAARNRSDVERQESKRKTGCFTGLEAINPATGERIPIWCADYVLMSYGFGAIMAVPAHDERDFEFAEVFGLPIRDVVYTRQQAAIAFIARHATTEERDDTRWIATLADFMGITTSRDMAPERFGEALNILRERRLGRPVGATIQLTPARQPTLDAPGSIGERRGSTRMTWMDTIGAMGMSTWGATVSILQEMRLCARAGRASPSLGYAANSTNEQVSLDGLATAEAKRRIVAWLEAEGIGRRKVNYRLRDWLFSRQRYWGEPFPIVWDEQGNHHPVDESALPVELPQLADYAPIESDDPLPLLAKAEGWVHTTARAAGATRLPPEAKVRRETNTMPGWAGSCWYFLRFCDPQNQERFVGEEAERYWMGAPRERAAQRSSEEKGDQGGVDLYIGGAEHAVLHLLYARFWHMALHDLGHVSTPEPFRRLFHQGLITSFAYQRADRSLVPIDEVWEARYHEDGGGFADLVVPGTERVVHSVDAPSLPQHIYERLQTGESLFLHFGPNADHNNWHIADVQIVAQVTAKMSKSLKNVVNPDDIIAEYGADTFRLYEMYMGPLEASKPWNTRDISGLFRFLQRAWRLLVDEGTGEIKLANVHNGELEKQLHRTIARVGADIESLSFNTAIAAMIEFVNAATAASATASGEPGPALTRDQAERFSAVLAPLAPHMAEELALKLGRDSMLTTTGAWPSYDKAMLRDDEVEIAVQLMGKVRARIMAPAGLDEDALREFALARPEVAALIAGKTVLKVIAVPGRLVNIVAN